MANPLGIPVSAQELESRISRVSKGDSLTQVTQQLGGPPDKEDQEGEKRRAYWRFHVMDREERADPYELYVGEFVNDELEFGFLLPHGSGAS